MFLNKYNLSIVIPVYKENQNIKKLILGIKNKIKISKYEIIIVDDDSKDGTKETCLKIKRIVPEVKIIIRKHKSKDLAQSCILGFENSLYKNILVMDGDMQHDPKYIMGMINLFIKKNLDIVIGCRNILSPKIRGLNYQRNVASKILIKIINYILDKKTNDPLSGFFIFKKELYTKNKQKLYGKGYKILADLLYCSKQNLKTSDFMIHFQPRAKGTSKINLKILLLLIVFVIKRKFKNESI
jgi:dolichol-phosphate mannosyltransferase